MDGSIPQQLLTIAVTLLLVLRSHSNTTTNKFVLQNTTTLGQDLSASVNDNVCGDGTIERPTNWECHWDYANDTTSPAAKPENISSYCTCDYSTRSCYSIISWTQPMAQDTSPVERYRLRFYLSNKIPSDGLLFCCQVPSTMRSINVTLENVSTENILGDLLKGIRFVFGAEPIDYSDIFYHHLEGPQEIFIKRGLPKHQEVYEGHSYTFTCEFTGYPLPNAEDVIWRHNQTIISNDNNRYNIIYGDSSSSLIITKVLQYHLGTYRCTVRSFFGARFDVYSVGTIDKFYPRNSTNPEKQLKKLLKEMKYIIAGGVFFILLVVVAAIYGLRLYQSKKYSCQHNDSATEKGRHTVYISHCSRRQENKKKILKFAYNLENHFSNIAVVIDLTRKVEINESGGFAQWIPDRMSNAYKILVILSKEYLEALKDVAYSDKDQVTKVQMEYRFIENLLYQNFHVSDKLIVAWQTDEEGEWPPALQGRNAYTLTKIKKSIKGSNICSLFSEYEDTKTDSV